MRGLPYGVVRQFERRAHMGEQNRILSLSSAGRSHLEGMEPAWTDAKHLAHVADWELRLFRIDGPEFHRLPSLAKKRWRS